MGRIADTSNGRRAVSIGTTAKAANPAAMTAGWPGRIVPAARPTAAKNATTAIIPMTSPTTATGDGTP